MVKAALVEIFLPVYDNAGRKIRASLFAETRAELIDRFGGLTAYSRVPARGFWRPARKVVRDDMIVLEVMLRKLDRTWWTRYRRKLERRFRQEQIVIRGMDCRLM